MHDGPKLEQPNPHIAFVVGALFAILAALLATLLLRAPALTPSEHRQQAPAGEPAVADARA